MYRAGSLLLLALTSCQNVDTVTHPPGTKIYEARGMHQCQNDKLVGYSCDMYMGNIIETGCATAHRTMMEKHCCNSVVVGGEYPVNAKSIGYTSLSCVQIYPPL